MSHLLRTVAYTFGDSSAQVVPGVLHKSFGDAQVQAATIALQRLIMLLCAYIHSGRCSTIIPQVLLVPHKRRRLGTFQIKECHSNRDAQVLDLGAEGRAAHDDWKSGWLAYSYIGGGVPNDPPCVTGLVSRHLPLDVADCLFAVLMFITGSTIQNQCFIAKPPSSCVQVADADARRDLRQTLISKREEMVSRRAAEVLAVLDQLNARYSGTGRRIEFLQCELSVLMTT